MLVDSDGMMEREEQQLDISLGFGYLLLFVECPAAKRRQSALPIASFDLPLLLRQHHLHLPTTYIPLTTLNLGP